MLNFFSNSFIATNVDIYAWIQTQPHYFHSFQNISTTQKPENGK